jgi:hypothetical protein
LQLTENRPLAEWRAASRLTPKPVEVTLIATDRICENFARQNSHGRLSMASITSDTCSNTTPNAAGGFEPPRFAP